MPARSNQIWFRHIYYLAGGTALAFFGPDFWNVTPLIAALAAGATTICFSLGDIIVDTRRLALRALAETARQRAVVHSDDYVVPNAVEPPSYAFQPKEMALDDQRAPDPMEEAASNLLQFAAHVSARCGSSRQPLAKDDVADAFANTRAELYLQPVVALPGRRTVHYKAQTRLRAHSGAVVMPSEFMPELGANELVAQLDMLQLESVIGLCHRIGDRHPETRIFCSLANLSLQRSCFRADLIELLQQQAELTQRIIFEIDANTVIALSAEILADIHTLEAMGFMFSVDGLSLADAGLIEGVFNHLAFVKIDAPTLDDDSDTEIFNVIARSGTQLIAACVETERQAARAGELGITLGQGGLFGRPRPAKMDVGAQRRVA